METPNNPACTESVKRLPRAEVGHYGTEEAGSRCGRRSSPSRDTTGMCSHSSSTSSSDYCPPPLSLVDYLRFWFLFLHPAVCPIVPPRSHSPLWTWSHTMRLWVCETLPLEGNGMPKPKHPLRPRFVLCCCCFVTVLVLVCPLSFRPYKRTISWGYLPIFGTPPVYERRVVLVSHGDDTASKIYTEATCSMCFTCT